MRDRMYSINQCSFSPLKKALSLPRQFSWNKGSSLQRDRSRFRSLNYSSFFDIGILTSLIFDKISESSGMTTTFTSLPLSSTLAVYNALRRGLQTTREIVSVQGLMLSLCTCLYPSQHNPQSIRRQSSCNVRASSQKNQSPVRQLNVFVTWLKMLYPCLKSTALHGAVIYGVSSQSLRQGADSISSQKEGIAYIIMSDHWKINLDIAKPKLTNQLLEAVRQLKVLKKSIKILVSIGLLKSIGRYEKYHDLGYKQDKINIIIIVYPSTFPSSSICQLPP